MGSLFRPYVDGMRASTVVEQSWAMNHSSVDSGIGALARKVSLSLKLSCMRQIVISRSSCHNREPQFLNESITNSIWISVFFAAFQTNRWSETTPRPSIRSPKSIISMFFSLRNLLLAKSFYQKTQFWFALHCTWHSSWDRGSNSRGTLCQEAEMDNDSSGQRLPVSLKTLANEIERIELLRVPHPLYSLDISLYVFWLFEPKKIVFNGRRHANANRIYWICSLRFEGKLQESRFPMSIADRSGNVMNWFEPRVNMTLKDIESSWFDSEFIEKTGQTRFSDHPGVINVRRLSLHSYKSRSVKSFKTIKWGLCCFWFDIWQLLLKSMQIIPADAFVVSSSMLLHSFRRLASNSVSYKLSLPHNFIEQRKRTFHD
jgi:hypothetical protein